MIQQPRKSILKPVVANTADDEQVTATYHEKNLVQHQTTIVTETDTTLVHGRDTSQFQIKQPDDTMTTASFGPNPVIPRPGMDRRQSMNRRVSFAPSAHVRSVYLPHLLS